MLYIYFVFCYKKNFLDFMLFYFFWNFVFYWFNDVLIFDVFIIYGNGLGNDEWVVFIEYKGIMLIVNCELFYVLGVLGGLNNC